MRLPVAVPGMDDLADRLERPDDDRTITAIPDGSVDAHCDVTTPAGDRIDSRDDLAARVAASGTASVALDRRALEPGGHAVHAAAQADVLGADATCYGYLDDSAFDQTPFASASMGRPARMTVCEFDDGDVVLQEASGDRDDWTLDALRDAAGGEFRDALTADAVVCAGWASFDGMAAALADLASLGLDGERFVFDVSGVAERPAGERRDLCDALGALAGSYDVTVTGNRREFDALAAAVDGAANSTETDGEADSDADATAETDEATCAAIRDAVGVEAVVLHEKARAVAATTDGETTVPNVDVDDPVRRTGAGDHFAGGLAHALAGGWDWEPALRLGNRCASHYVATGRTGSPAELEALADD